jgi:hypothetical protein
MPFDLDVRDRDYREEFHKLFPALLAASEAAPPQPTKPKRRRKRRKKATK